MYIYIFFFSHISFSNIYETVKQCMFIYLGKRPDCSKMLLLIYIYPLYCPLSLVRTVPVLQPIKTSLISEVCLKKKKEKWFEWAKSIKNGS